MPVVAVRSWFGGGALTALAVLTSSVCGGVVNVDSMPNGSIDHPHLNHTVGYHCWSDRDCNVHKFERCSTYNICVCEFAYDYDRYQCKSCPNEHQPCSECCPQDTHECTESQSQCQEREWWRPPPTPTPSVPIELPVSPVSPFFIVVALLGGMSIFLLMWHCCCRKRPDKATERPTVAVAVRSTAPAAPLSTTIAVESAPPFSAIASAPPPSYIEAIRMDNVKN